MEDGQAWLGKDLTMHAEHWNHDTIPQEAGSTIDFIPNLYQDWDE